MAVTVYVGTPHIPLRGRQRAWEVRYGRDHTGQEQDRAAHGGFLRREHGAEPHRARAADLRAGRGGPGRGQTGGDFRHLLHFPFPARLSRVPAQHNPRSPMRAAGAVLPADPALLIHPSVQPREGEPVIAKHRTSAFSGSAFDTILRAQGIETLILMGHATSGVILSTVRLAADLDYHVIVVEDGCADRDPEVHQLLMEKVFPRQATVVSAAELVAALAA